MEGGRGGARRERQREEEEKGGRGERERERERRGRERRKRVGENRLLYTCIQTMDVDRREVSETGTTGEE